MTSTPESPDPQLLEAHDLARAALLEITPESTVGPPAGYLPEQDGVVSLRFENRLGGYPGWYWTVSVARVGDEAPTVLEAELLPADGALLAPEWVPWSVRLAEYQAAQAVLEAEAAAARELEGADGADEAGADDDLDDELDDDIDDVDDLDAVDFDADGSSILHAGDVDGVDIDELSADYDVDADDDADDDDADGDADDADIDADDDDDDLDDDADGDADRAP